MLVERESVKLFRERLLWALLQENATAHTISHSLRCLFREIDDCLKLSGVEKAELERVREETQSDTYPWPEGTRQATIKCLDAAKKIYKTGDEKVKELRERVEAVQLWHLNIYGDARPNENIVKYRAWIKDKDMSDCMGPDSQYMALISKDDG